MEKTFTLPGLSLRAGDFLDTMSVPPGHFHKKTKGNYNQRFLVCLLNWNCFLLQMPVDEAACKYIALELVTLQGNK